MVNRVTLIGNIGDAPEVRTLESGAHVAKFSLATNENYKDRNGEWQQNTEWHNIVAWRHLAERAKTLEKGTMLYLEGKLTHRKYQDKDGNNRYITEVVANYYRTIQRSSSDSNSGYSQPTVSQDNTSNSNSQSGDNSTDATDDLPF